jgi:hypothetical protein
MFTSLGGTLAKPSRRNSLCSWLRRRALLHWCRRAKSKWPAFRCRKKIKEKNGYGAITVKDVAGDTDMEKCASVDLEVKW